MYIFIWKSIVTKREGDTEKEIFSKHRFILQMAAMLKAGLVQSQKPGSFTLSHTWMQGLWPSACCFPRPPAGSFLQYAPSNISI